MKSRYPPRPLAPGEQRALRGLAARAHRRRTVGQLLETRSLSLWQRVSEHDQERKGTMIQFVKDAISGLINNAAVRLAFYSLLAAILAYIGDLLHVAKVIP